MNENILLLKAIEQTLIAGNLMKTAKILNAIITDLENIPLEARVIPLIYGHCGDCVHRMGEGDYMQCNILSSEDPPWESSLNLVHREDGTTLEWSGDYKADETIYTYKNFGCVKFESK